MTAAPAPPNAPLTPAAFIAKWKRAKLSERAASHEHFLDLCRLLNQPTPAAHDATGAEYTFEKGLTLGPISDRGGAGLQPASGGSSGGAGLQPGGVAPTVPPSAALSGRCRACNRRP